MTWQRYCQCGRGDSVDLILLKEALSKMDAPCQPQVCQCPLTK